jgi:hypothetical protein
MTTKVDGSNGVLQNYAINTPTTGFSYTFAAGTQTLLLTPAGTLATGTVTMPPSPVDGMLITIQSTQQVTALTVSGNTGQTVVGGTTQLLPNQPLTYIYNLSGTTWYPFAGGAGRASALVLGTSQATTSGSVITFSGIPSWARRITVMFNTVSTSGTSGIIAQLGSGSTDTTSTYTGQYGRLNNANQTGAGSFSTSFLIVSATIAADNYSGSAVFTTLGGNVWSMTSTVGENIASTGLIHLAGGVKAALSGALDRVVISTGNAPTDTFDLGSINIMYE